MSKARTLIDKFTDSHPLPSVMTTVTELINDSESTMKDFEEVIQLDPILVSRLLGLVNSAYYGLSQPVDSIGRAVAFLGMKNLHNLVVTDSVRRLFTEKNAGTVFSKKRLWLHCAAVSICGKMVSERIFGINGDDAFLCGILHDFGLLVLEQHRSEEFHALCNSSDNSKDFVIQEKAIFAIDHCEIGQQMAIDWNMPDSIQRAIRDHHSNLADIDPQSLTGIIQIAEFLAAELSHNTLPDLIPEISTPLMEHLEDNRDEYAILLEDLPDEMDKAQVIYG